MACPTGALPLFAISDGRASYFAAASPNLIVWPAQMNNAMGSLSALWSGGSATRTLTGGPEAPVSAAASYNLFQVVVDNPTLNAPVWFWFQPNIAVNLPDPVFRAVGLASPAGWVIA